MSSPIYIYLKQYSIIITQIVNLWKRVYWFWYSSKRALSISRQRCKFVFCYKDIWGDYIQCNFALSLKNQMSHTSLVSCTYFDTYNDIDWDIFIYNKQMVCAWKQQNVHGFIINKLLIWGLWLLGCAFDIV